MRAMSVARSATLGLWLRQCERKGTHPDRPVSLAPIPGFQCSILTAAARLPRASSARFLALG
jgi:hypothetical protein